MPHRPRHADGQPHAPVLAAGDSLGRAAAPDGAAAARAAAGRGPDRLPHHVGPGRPGAEQLPASRRVAVLRTQRRRGPALRLPRLEVRRRRHTASTCPTSRPSPTSRPKSRPSPTRRANATASSGRTWARARRRRRCPTSKPTCWATDDLVISIIHRPCNWMQGWEGEMDTVHQAFLHSGRHAVEDTVPGTFDYYIASTPRAAVRGDRHARTARRMARTARRRRTRTTGASRTCCFRSTRMIPAGLMGQQTRFAAYVPMDDEHTLHWEIGKRLIDPERVAARVRAGSEAGGPRRGRLRCIGRIRPTGTAAST